MKYLFIKLAILVLVFNSCNDTKDNFNYKYLLKDNFFPLEEALITQSDYSTLFPPAAFFDGGLSSYESKLDTEGIALYDFEEKMYYHPSLIGSYGLYLYFEYYKNENIDIKNKFLKQAKWLSENIQEKEDFIVWEIPFENKEFLLDAPYSSALTNSWCSAVLLLASQFENKELYLSQAKKGLKYQFVEINNGGSLGVWEDGKIWFEEYPVDSNVSHVLNGNLFSIDILHLFYEVTKKEEYYIYLEKSFKSLDKHIEKFNVGYGSIYDMFLKGNKLGAGYHRIHAVQLLWAYKITGNRNFMIHAKQFFEQEQQNKYKIESTNCIDCENHGIDHLNNNIFWYNSWSSNDLEIKFNILLPKEEEIYRFNFFANSLASFPDSITVKFKDNEFINLNLKTFDAIGYSTYNKTETFVKSIVLNKLIKSKNIEILIYNPNKKVVALRNLGIQYLQNEEFINKYDKLNNVFMWYSRKEKIE